MIRVKYPFLPHRPLTAKEIRLIPESFFFLLRARLAVSFQSSAAYLPRPSSEAGVPVITAPMMEAAKTIAGVIEGLSRRTPWNSTCLVRTLAAYNMLVRRNIPCMIHLGVYKNTLPGQLGAHAWLSVGEQVLVGGGRLERYSEIARLG